MIPAPAYWSIGMNASSPDRQARADRRRQPRMHLGEPARPGQAVVPGHAEAETDRRGLDREAADENRRRDDEQEHGRERVAEVRVDDLGGPEAVLERVSEVRDREQHREQEDGADQERADDRADDRLRRLAARVTGLLGQRAGRVEAVDHEERHEHRDQKRPERQALAAPWKTTAPLW